MAFPIAPLLDVAEAALTLEELAALPEVVAVLEAVAMTEEVAVLEALVETFAATTKLPPCTVDGVVLLLTFAAAA